MFIRALSGAGYVTTDASESTSLHPPNASFNKSSSLWASHVPIAESQWARWRNGVADTLWRCPALNEVSIVKNSLHRSPLLTSNNNHLQLSKDQDTGNSTQSGHAYTPGCLKAKLQNVVRAHTEFLGNKAIAKESPNFEVPSIPSLLKSSSPTVRLPPNFDGPKTINADSTEDPSSSSPTMEDEPPSMDDEHQIVEEERPRANLSPKHGGSGSRNGFEIRRKPH